MEIPECLKKFPLWKDRFPIHFTVWVDEEGVPNFKVMHERRREEAFVKNLCHICGDSLGGTPIYTEDSVFRVIKGKLTRIKQKKVVGVEGGEYAFIGGPKCVKQHKFVDGPMHIECAEFSAKACPFLSSMKYKSTIPIQIGRSISGKPDGLMMVKREDDPLVDLRDNMALVVSKAYLVVRNSSSDKEYGGGPHTNDPNAPNQLAAKPGEYIRIDWNIMPNKM